MSDSDVQGRADSQRQPIEIDGRTLEGGGQLLRLTVGLSALTNTPVRITSIRGNRSAGGGLKPQHLACVNWLTHASQANVSGAEKGSQTLDFKPSYSGLVSPVYALVKDKNSGNRFWDCRLDIKTAGSTTLALQAILPFILFKPPKKDDGTPSKFPVRLTISGGTNVSASPSYEYITQVLLPTLQDIGLPPISARLNKRGWSHGGSNIGSFTLEIRARRSLALPAFQLCPEDTTRKPKLPTRIDATFLGPAAAHSHLKATLGPALDSYFGPSFANNARNLDLTCEDTRHDKRYYLLLVASVDSSSSEEAPARMYRLGRDWLYDRRVRAPESAVEDLVEKVCRDLHAEWSSGAYVDEHMRDQLVVFQALADGKNSTFAGLDESGQPREPSLHARTAEWVAGRLLDSNVRKDAVGSINAN